MIKMFLSIFEEIQRIIKRYMMLRKPRQWGIGILLVLDTIIRRAKDVLKSDDCKCKRISTIEAVTKYKCYIKWGD